MVVSNKDKTEKVIECPSKRGKKKKIVNLKREEQMWGSNGFCLFGNHLLFQDVGSFFWFLSIYMIIRRVFFSKSSKLSPTNPYCLLACWILQYASKPSLTEPQAFPASTSPLCEAQTFQKEGLAMPISRTLFSLYCQHSL